MQKWSPVLQLCSRTPYRSPVLLETNFLSLQLCSSSPYRDRQTNRQTNRQTEDRKSLWEPISYAKMVSGTKTNFLSLQICSRFPYGSPTDKQTSTGDRQSLGEHFSYAQMVSGVTGDKVFVCVTLFQLPILVTGVTRDKLFTFATLFQLPTQRQTDKQTDLQRTGDNFSI